MKAKTVKITLSRKFSEFLESITDPALKDMVSKNSMISGGAIASMLLREEVSDFDVYFLNKETALAVANYYIRQFNELNPFKMIQTDIIASDDRIQIKVYSTGVLEEENEGEEKKKEKPTYRPVYISSNAITLSDKIQLVVRFFGSPEEIHSNFDFVHCTNYWLSGDNRLELNLKAMESLLSKELIYIGSKYPLCSVIRTRKFIDRNWTINAGQYLKMCYQISRLNLDNIDVLKDQLIGVDSLYFSMLIQALEAQKERNPDFTYGYEYICEIVDKVFNN